MLTKNIADMRAEAHAHIAADKVTQGQYWEGGKGCFIGCLVHSSDAQSMADRFGLPLSSIRIAERIFESLPAEDAPAFFGEVVDAIDRDGRDLSCVHWAFLADALRHMPPQSGAVKDAIDHVIEGMDTLASGKDGPAAAT